MKYAVILALASLLLVSACGDDAAKKQREANARRALVAKRQAADERHAEQVKYDKCNNALGDFVDALGELHSRIQVGLNYDEFGTQVGNVKVAYDRVPFSTITDMDCLSKVGVPAESAFNAYGKASSTWDHCFNSDTCVLDDIDPTLQRDFSRATSLLKRAQRGLRSLQP